MTITQKQIETRLQNIIDPLTGRDVMQAGLVSSIVIRGGHVGLMLSVTRETHAARAPLGAAIEAALRELEGVEKVTPVFTAESAPVASSKPTATRPAQWNLTPIPHVKRVIAVGSGKGGVGKSTVTVLLARSLQAQGLHVGIVDADIHGPSIPHMLGLHGKPEVEDGLMIPPCAEGIACASTGLLLEADQAAIMRGPMVSKTLAQLLRQTRWGTEDAPLDVLLLDLPPGTGDIQLSMVQQVPLAYGGGGAVLVTTPQEVALLDARKAAAMFTKTHVPILGVIENMSWFEDANGTRQMIFGEGGGKTLADTLSVPLLAQIPLLPALRAAADAGEMARCDAPLLALCLAQA